MRNSAEYVETNVFFAIVKTILQTANIRPRRVFFYQSVQSGGAYSFLPIDFLNFGFTKSVYQKLLTQL